MPTNVFISIEQRRAIERRDAADLRAALLLTPLILGLGTIALAIKSPAFAAAMIILGTE